MLKWLCTLIFKLTGWKYVDGLPVDVKSFVMIGAPHTSNYDFIPAMAVARLMKRNARFVIKQEWLRFPLNLILQPMGAVGLDRQLLKEKGQKNTDVMAAFFAQHSEFVLMISPEGTRSPNADWKTGFYYIAQKAQVPLVLGFADYKKKEAGIGPVIYPRDFESDMKTIMNFYQDKQGKFPRNFLLDKRYLS